MDDSDKKDLDFFQRENFIHALLSRERMLPMVAEAVAAMLDRLPAGSRVGFYACGLMARILVKTQRRALERLDTVFILTDPKGVDRFQGFPLVPAAALAENPPGDVVILSTRHQREMSAQVAFLPEGHIHCLVPLIEAYGLDGLMERALASIHESIRLGALRMARELPRDRKRVLFLSLNPPQHLVKTMAAAAGEGFAVAVVVESLMITPTISLADYAGKGCFHSLYHAEYWPAYEFLELEKRLKPLVDHVEVYMGTSESVAHILERRAAPAAVEYRDFPQTVFRGREEAIQAMRVPPEDYDLEVARQKRIYLSADGVIMKDAPETLDFLEDLYGHRPRHVLPFFHYFSEEWADAGPVEKLSAATGEPHLVYAGGVVNDPGWHNYPLYHSLLEAGRILADQQIHLTIYNAGDSSGEGFEDYLRLAEDCPFFHYHPAVPYSELKHVLPRHDFGWFCFDFSEARENPFFHKITMGSKVFSYLEAGLPVLISPEQEFMARIVTRDLGSGILMPFKDLGNLKQTLLQQDWAPIRANILEARKHWTYREHGHRLREFYELLGRP